jgi:hypothetical protein
MPYLLILLFQQDTIVINLQEHNRFESLPGYFPKLEIQIIFFQVAAIVLGPEMYDPYVFPQTKQKCLSLPVTAFLKSGAVHGEIEFQNPEDSRSYYFFKVPRNCTCPEKQWHGTSIF